MGNVFQQSFSLHKSDLIGNYSGVEKENLYKHALTCQLLFNNFLRQVICKCIPFS